MLKAVKKHATTSEGPAETSQQKFERLALKRMRQLKKYSRLVANLARYDHTKEQCAAVCNAVEDCAAAIVEAFDKPDREDRDNFAF